MALVHDDNRVRTGQSRDERGIVGALYIHRRAHILLVGSESGERGVLCVGAPPVLVLEGIIGKNEQRKLITHSRSAERAAPKSVLLVEHLHASREVAVEAHAQEVLGVPEVTERLYENLPPRHEPYHNFIV